MIKNVVVAIGVTEVLIGSVTLLTSIISWTLALYNKPLAVTIFVISASLVSLLLGIGLLKLRTWARKLIIFFAGYVILTKVLILSGIIVLSGALETSISPGIKNSVSMIYHAFILMFFTRCPVKDKFK